MLIKTVWVTDSDCNGICGGDPLMRGVQQPQCRPCNCTLMIQKKTHNTVGGIEPTGHLRRSAKVPKFAFDHRAQGQRVSFGHIRFSYWILRNLPNSWQKGIRNIFFYTPLKTLFAFCDKYNYKYENKVPLLWDSLIFNKLFCYLHKVKSRNIEHFLITTKNNL